VANVVEFLKEFRKREHKRKSSGSQNSQVKAILSSTVEEFSRKDLAILVRSYLLGEDILLVSNPRCMQLVEGEYVTYLPEELEVISQLSPGFIKKIHRLKKLCDGEILKEGLRLNGKSVIGKDRSQ